MLDCEWKNYLKEICMENAENLDRSMRKDAKLHETFDFNTTHILTFWILRSRFSSIKKVLEWD